MLIFCYLPYSFAEGIHLSGGKRLTLLCRQKFNFNLSLKLYNPEKIHSRCAFFSYVDRDYGHSFLRNCHVTLHPFQLVPRNPNHRSTNVPDPRLFVGNRRLCLFGTGHLFFQPRRPTCLCHMDRSKCMSDRSKKGVFFILALKDVRGQVEWVRQWCRIYRSVDMVRRVRWSFTYLVSPLSLGVVCLRLGDVVCLRLGDVASSEFRLHRGRDSLYGFGKRWASRAKTSYPTNEEVFVLFRNWEVEDDTMRQEQS